MSGRAQVRKEGRKKEEGGSEPAGQTTHSQPRLLGTPQGKTMMNRVVVVVFVLVVVVVGGVIVVVVFVCVVGVVIAVHQSFDL